MTDREIQESVENALEWEPSIDTSDMGVSVEGGVVTLRGDITSHAEKMAAERIALGVRGVKGIANDLNVRLRDTHRRSDTDIAHAAVVALRRNDQIPDDTISVSVSDGWVTLKGHADWEHQRVGAETAVRGLTGVRGVTNLIAVASTVRLEDVRSKIENALKHGAEVDARRINVAIADNKVILSGSVHSFFERDEARRAAWSAPGVKEVDDHIAVVP